MSCLFSPACLYVIHKVIKLGAFMTRFSQRRRDYCHVAERITCWRLWESLRTLVETRRVEISCVSVHVWRSSTCQPPRGEREGRRNKMCVLHADRREDDGVVVEEHWLSGRGACNLQPESFALSFNAYLCTSVHQSLLTDQTCCWMLISAWGMKSVHKIWSISLSDCCIKLIFIA